MKTTTLLRVASKGLGANKIRTFLMMLGIVVGIAALTVIMAAGAGTKAKLQERTSQMFAQAPITVIVKRPGAGFTRGSETGADASPTTLTISDAEAIATQIANVATVAPTQRQSGVPVVYRDRSTTTQVFGIVAQWQQLRSYQVAEGEFITDDDVEAARRVCLLGSTVADELFGDEYALDQTIRIESTPFQVIGVLAPKGSSPMGGDFDNRVVIPLSTFSRRLYNVSHLSQIVIGLHDPGQMRATAAEIEALMRDRRGVTSPEDQDFDVRLADQVVAVAGEMSRVLTVFLAVVAGISLLVGGVVVMNIMLISVSERTREIGLRRAVGATRRDIQAQFRTEALLVTLIGGALGVLIGVAVATMLPLVSETETAFSWQAIALAAGFSIAVGLVFGVQPARRAARMHPVEALRSE